MFKVPTFDPTDPEFRYEFTTPDGKEWSVPKIQYVPLPVMESAQKKDGVAFVELLREIDPKVGAAVAKFSAAQLSALEKDWITESGSTVGESLASTS